MAFFDEEEEEEEEELPLPDVDDDFLLDLSFKPGRVVEARRVTAGTPFRIGLPGVPAVAVVVVVLLPLLPPPTALAEEEEEEI